MKSAVLTKPAPHIARLEAKQREELRKEERQAKARAEAKAVMEGVAETVRLDEEERGAEFDHPRMKRGETDPKPIRRITGLMWLLRKKRLTAEQFDAGEKYAAHYEILYSGVTPQSSLNIGPGGCSLEPASALVYAHAKLSEARREGLKNQRAMIDACDKVCGQGLMPREITTVQREAEKIEDALLIALDLLATHYGLTAI